MDECVNVAESEMVVTDASGRLMRTNRARLAEADCPFGDSAADFFVSLQRA